MQLFFISDVQTGLVWMTKILTDPFHDIKLYYKAPLHLLRGELIDPHRMRADEPAEACEPLGRRRWASRLISARERCASISRRIRAGSTCW